MTFGSVTHAEIVENQYHDLKLDLFAMTTNEEYRNCLFLVRTKFYTRWQDIGYKAEKMQVGDQC